MKLVKQYYTFIKYIISALLSFFIDLGIFTIISKLLSFIIGDIAIIIGTIIARIISSLVNYLLNKNKVFNHDNGKSIDRSTLIKYYSLVVIQMFVSAFSVWITHKLIHIDVTIIKIIVDGLIFIVNYFVQKKYIFKK